LEKEGYTVQCAQTGEEALDSVRRKPPDLIVLDLLLPNIDGLEVCRELKRNPQTEKIHIVILSAKGEESDVVLGLEMGADDYVTKPFSPRMLLARIRSVLRRRTEPIAVKEKQQFEDLVIDPARHEVQAGGKKINLTFTEFEILRILAQRPGQVFTRFNIMDSIHGSDYIVSARAVDVQIVSLRKKLGRYQNYIETVRGVGYRFKDYPDTNLTSPDV